MTMRRSWRWAGSIAAAAALTLGAAACGSAGAAKDSLAAGSSSAAGIAPADAIAYFAVDSSLSSGQWKQAGALLSRFPDRTKLVTQLLQSWKDSTQTSFQSDVRPALGDQLDGVVFARAGARDPEVVLLLQPKDANAFRRLVTKQPTAVGDYRGWKVVGQTQAAIAAFEADAKAGPALADDATFKEATGSLAGDMLATVYTNGARLTSAATGAFPQARAMVARGRLDWAIAGLAAMDAGVRLDAAAKTTGGGPPLSPSKATLLDRIPADALGVLWFDGGTFRARAKDVPGVLQQGLGATGTTVPALPEITQAFTRLGGLFAHETALYVRRGAGPIPEVTLVTMPADPAAADATVENAVRSLAGGLLSPTPIAIGPVRAHTVALGSVSLYWGADQGRFVVTTSQQAFADLRGGGAALAGDATFKEAVSQAGMPDATDGFLYVNLSSAIQTIEGFAQAAGSPLAPELQNNLKPLHTGLAWITNDGAVDRYSTFVGVN